MPQPPPAEFQQLAPPPQELRPKNIPKAKPLSAPVKQNRKLLKAVAAKKRAEREASKISTAAGGVSEPPIPSAYDLAPVPRRFAVGDQVEVNLGSRAWQLGQIIADNVEDCAYNAAKGQPLGKLIPYQARLAQSGECTYVPEDTESVIRASGLGAATSQGRSQSGLVSATDALLEEELLQEELLQEDLSSADEGSTDTSEEEEAAVPSSHTSSGAQGPWWSLTGIIGMKACCSTRATGPGSFGHDLVKVNHPEKQRNDDRRPSAAVIKPSGKWLK